MIRSSCYLPLVTSGRIRAQVAIHAINGTSIPAKLIYNLVVDIIVLANKIENIVLYIVGDLLICWQIT